MSKKPPLSAEEARALTDQLREVLGSRDYLLATTQGGSSRQPSTYTYFIQVDDPQLRPLWPIKIGCAADPHARLAQLQTASPFDLWLMGYVPGGEKLERELHRKWAHLHIRGEWYRSTEFFESEIYGMILDYDEEQIQ